MVAAHLCVGSPLFRWRVCEIFPPQKNELSSKNSRRVSELSVVLFSVRGEWVKREHQSETEMCGELSFLLWPITFVNSELLPSSSCSLSYRSFLFSKEGNPNKRNVHNETCLHVLCQGPQILLLSEGALSPRLARPQRDEQRRAECLQVRPRGGRERGESRIALPNNNADVCGYARSSATR